MHGFMKTRTPEIARAVAHLARVSRWHPGSPEVAEARRALAAAKLARAEAEAERLKAELDEMTAAS